jgi:SAM-dependent methyltransferase
MFNSGIGAGLRNLLGSSQRRAKTVVEVGVVAKGQPSSTLTNEEYWSSQNVTHHAKFSSSAESLAYFHWRNDNYYDYIDLMPVSGQDGKVVLDYGCGPGNDIVGFATLSRPARLIAADVSRPSLDEAAERLSLHGGRAEFIKMSDENARIPLPDASVDLVHCSGVLMCVRDDLATLREFRRILKPGGAAQLMVYNYNCIWYHLFAGYIRRFTDPNYRGATTQQAFFESTDWVNCPMNRVWTVPQFAALSEAAGLSCEHLGNATAVREVEVLPRRFEAILERRLEEEHRRFLLELTFDARGVPHFRGKAAGIDACYRLRPV